MSFESTMRWLVVGGIVLVVALFVWTAVGQESPPVKGDLAPATSAPADQGKATEAAPTTTPVGATSAQPGPGISAESPEATKPSSPNDAPTFKSWKDKVSYAFGVDLARDLKRQRNDLNIDLLMKAMGDALSDKPLLLSNDEVTATVKRVEQEQKDDFEHAKAMLSEKNRKAGEAFFAENARKEGVVTLPSGLQYKILKKGEGKVPTVRDAVVCKYKGTLLDGTEFDSSEKRGGQVTVPVKGLLAGWTQALQMMPVGSKWQLFIPPQLAYGDKIVHGLAPNTSVIFDVELVSIEEKSQTAQAVSAK
jgi:FKBP-type peptidyl-prolyl cis-trans isomerase FklB